MEIEIMAEVAQGYEGNPELARLLVKGALAANADSIKFQIIYAEELCVPGYEHYELFSSLEMPQSVWQEIVRETHAAGKKIYFDVFGKRSLQLAVDLGVDGVKITTTDFYNATLIKLATESFDKIFLSVGGIPIEHVDLALQGIPDKCNITLMHGFQAEPTLTEDNNLGRIAMLKLRYPGVAIGYMDHTLGMSDDAFYMPLVALGAGVTCIEKHITLDHLLDLEDNISALTPERFQKFVSMTRNIERAIGSTSLELTSKELEYRKKAGKVAVASGSLKKGHQLTESDIELKRVAVPGDYFKTSSELFSRVLVADLEVNEAFTNASFE